MEIQVEEIQSRIVTIRGEKAMLDKTLAELYGVDTKQLKRAVRRNKDRFPLDFMFELTWEEYESLRSQFGTLKERRTFQVIPPWLLQNRAYPCFRRF